MLTISKPLSASQAQSYHKKEFTSREQNYWSQRGEISGEWQGRLAVRFGLNGPVAEGDFARLSQGQHPQTGEQLVRQRASYQYQDANGKTITTMEHRAGWDATFSAPKSVSLTALVGGDERVREAHRESVRVALDQLERYTQARIGGNHPPETTGKFIAAKFEHDTARPVDGYVAPQLHTHAVVFNVTERDNGQPRAIQPHSLFASQQFATAVYQSELTYKLRQLGYEIATGRSGAPEIKGYTQEYLEASSPRRQQIEQRLAEQGRRGAGAAQIAAHRTRDAKQPLSIEEVRAQHQKLAAEHGNQPARVMAEAARRWGVELEPERSQRVAESAVTYARERGMERAAVVDERALLRDALRHTMCEARLPEIKAEIEKRIAAGDLVDVPRREGEAGRAFTTDEMQSYERDIVRRMQAGRDKNVIVDGYTREWTFKRHPHLSVSQHRAVEDVLESRDKMMALEGVAGAGKTTSLAAVRDAVVHHGYEVKGLAPTSRAAQKLAEAGMETETLQRHLARGGREDDGRARVYIVDEASMVGTRQMHTLLERLNRHDRVLFVGDVRQHEAVEAGRPYAQLQEAGLRTARLDEILRQKDPVLKETVEQLARGEVKEAIASLNSQGRVHEIKDRGQRFGEMAREYARLPDRTLVISPDNESRREINGQIHRAMRESGQVTGTAYRVPVLYARQELTGADRQHAQNYTEGDVLRYSKGSKPIGIEAGEYARIVRVDGETNTLTITRKSGEELSYDPRRLQGVTVYRDSERVFAQGDRVQMTAPYQKQNLANRELGTVEKIDVSGNLKLRMDSGREVEFNVRQMPHLDYGYAVTSHSSQGQTADRVLVHVDSSQAHGELLNSRMAYVSVSRAEFDVQMYTNDAKSLGHVLSRDVSHPSAMQQTIHDELAGLKIGPQSQGKEVIQQDFGIGLGL